MNGDRSDALSVIVACYNEQDHIEECLRRIIQAAPRAEIIVVHGGTDQTAARAENVGRTSPQIRVVRNKDDRGKGHAIKVGIQQASRNVMVQIDADLQFMPEEILKVALPLVTGEADVSLGCRFMKESNVENYQFSFFRTVGNRIVNAWVSLLAGRRFYDTTTGFKAWTRDAIDAIRFKDDRFVYEAEIAVRGAMQNCRFAMIPVTYFNRRGGVSGHGAGLWEVWSIIRTGFKILFLSACARLHLW